MRTPLVCSAVLALTLLASCDPEDPAATDDGGPDAGSPTPATDSGAGTGGGADGAVEDGAVDGPGADAGQGMPCAAATGAGTLHQGTISADETWTAADSPHVVTAAIHITGATLSIEPCAVVRLRKGLTIDVGGASAGLSGELVAHGEYLGTTRRPVVFERDEAAEPWGSLRAFDNGLIDLEHVDLHGGGDHETAVNNGGTLIAEGAGGNVGLTRNLRVVDVVIEDSAGYGVNLRARAAFTDNSDSLVIRGSGNVPPPGNVDTRYPVYVAGAAFSTIPSGSYTGNARDEIFVAQVGSLSDPMLTFHERGVPYRLESAFSMQPMNSAAQGGLSTLMIEAGTVIRFTSSVSDVWSMTLGASSGTTAAMQWPVRLIANGTPQAPIVLTSAEDNPVAGSWGGVEWHAGPATGNVMSNVHIEFAGADGSNSGFGCGPGDNDAALFLGDWVPSDAFIEGCTFSDSAGAGIVCGWRSDAAGPNFAVQNTFEDIGNDCNVSVHEDSDGNCPMPGPSCD